MGNSVTGGYRTTAAKTMAAFDKLPPSARAALSGAVENWVCQPVLTRFNRRAKGFCNGPEIAETVARWNRDELAKREHQRSRAIGPYKGNVPDNMAAQTRRK